MFSLTRCCNPVCYKNCLMNLNPSESCKIIYQELKLDKNNPRKLTLTQINKEKRRSTSSVIIFAYSEVKGSEIRFYIFLFRCLLSPACPTMKLVPYVELRIRFCNSRKLEFLIRILGHRCTALLIFLEHRIGLDCILKNIFIVKI